MRLYHLRRAQCAIIAAMHIRRFDLCAFLPILGGALLGAAWALYNRGQVQPPYNEGELRPLVWSIFATPLGTLLGWLAARWRERWWALFTCFCVYFFSPFVAARYESCTVVHGRFDLVSCVTQTGEAQRLADANGHAIYFQAIVAIQIAAALAIALHRALAGDTIAPETAAGEAARRA